MLPIERLSEAKLKETIECIVEMKQYLLGMYEKIVDIQHAFIEMNWMPSYMFEDDYLDSIAECQRAMDQTETHIARFIHQAATEQKKFQYEIEHRRDEKKKKEEEQIQTTMREDSLRLVELGDIGLGVQVVNALGQAGINNLLDLSTYSLNEISQIWWMGEKGISELCQKVKKYPDFSFKEDENGGTQ